MASYLASLKLPSVSTANLGSTISNRFQTVRKALGGTTETDDENDPELSHISNVLRAYYTEKGRPFPNWLPPDPRAPQPQTIPQQPPQNSYGGYGAMQNPYGAPAPSQRNSDVRGGGGLSDLWDTSSGPTQSQTQPQSLRAGRMNQGPRPSHIAGNSMVGGSAPTSPPRATAAARPLPSQKVGSYQASLQQSEFNRVGSSGSAGSGGGGGGGDSARDRLRARLQAGGSSGRESPTTSSGSGGYGASAYGAGSSSGGGAGGGPAYMSASRPWDNGGSDGFDGGYRGGGGSGGGYGGTPGGGGAAATPASNRRAGMVGGLPSNPKVGGSRGPR